MRNLSIAGFDLGPSKSVKFKFATTRDIKSLTSWRRVAQLSGNPMKLDAAEFAELAFRRWREGKGKKRAANSVEDIRDFVRDNLQAEVHILVLAKAPWLRIGTIVGVCHFRRTWANNIYVDYLSVHPFLIRNPSNPLPNLGSALLYFVSCVADEIQAGKIWGETTQNSVQFYEKIFGRGRQDDMLDLERDHYMAFKK